MGGHPTFLGHLPDHLLLYKRASSLHFFTPHTSHFSRQTSSSRPLAVQREFGREGQLRKSREEERSLGE
jgi:hypothetical protein